MDILIFSHPVTHGAEEVEGGYGAFVGGELAESCMRNIYLNGNRATERSKNSIRVFLVPFSSEDGGTW